MSLTKGATRLSLLAGSSLVLLGAAALMLTPSAARAQTCTPAAPPAANPDPDTYECSGTPHAGGIAYTSAGSPLVLTTTTDGMDVGAVGIDMTGVGADSVTFNSDVEIDGVGITGALLEMRSDTGTITVNNAGSGIFLDADEETPANMTHGLLAVSNSGNIVVAATGGIWAEAGADSPLGVAGVEARTGGAGSITLTTGQVRGRMRGIHAVAEDGDIVINATSVSTAYVVGTLVDINGIEAITGGDISITATGSIYGQTRGIVTDTSSGDGDTLIVLNGAYVSAIGARTGSGDLHIDLDNAAVSLSETKAAITTDTGGDAVIDISAGSILDGGLDLTVGAGTTTTLNNFGRYGQTSGFDSLLVRNAAGAGHIVINNHDAMGGRIDLSGNSGGSDIDITAGGRWRLFGDNAFGSGNDTLTVDERALVGTGSGQQFGEQGADRSQIDFGGGDNTFANAGVFVIGVAGGATNGTEGNPMQNDTEVRLLNLDSFDNAGTILLGGTMPPEDGTQIYAHRAGRQTIGAFDGTDDVLVQASDQWFDDVLSMPGATFTGAEGSRILFDVNLMSDGQASCDPALRATNGDMPAADCVLIEGGETAGTTLVTVYDVFAGDRGVYNATGITLVDVNGGTSDGDHFTLDPLSSSYNPEHGGVIDKGVFFYPLVYDEDTQRHQLVGLVSDDAAQFPLLAGAAHSLWRVSTGSWLDRQADLRGDFDAEGEGGVWLRINSEFAERDVAYETGAYGTTFSFDNSFSQTSYAVTGGVDLIVGEAGNSAWVVGLMAGYAHADIDFDVSGNTGELDGWTGGAYASFVSGGLFVDAVINANKLDLKNDIPSLGLFPAGTILDTHLLSVGGQIEAGYRIPLSDSFFVEPLAGVSYVRTTYDELEVPAGDPASPRIGVEFDDPTSLRASIGARAGIGQQYGGVRAQYSGLVRLWNEFDGETTVTLQNLGADPVVTDDFSGQFTEVGVGASLYSGDGLVSGFLNLGGKFGDDYKASSAAAGVRVTW